jgi:hypothetical protein
MLSDYEHIKGNQTTFSSMNRIQGRYNANFCVKDVVVLDEAIDGAVILAFLEGTGSNVNVGVTSASTSKSTTSIDNRTPSPNATMIAPSSTSTSFSKIATTSTDATTAIATNFTSSAATSSTLIATVIASTSAAGSIEPWVVGVIIGGALLVLLLVGLTVFCVLNYRRAHEMPAADGAAELKQPQSEYGRFVAPAPSYGDVADIRAPADVHSAPATAAYGILKVKTEYDAPDSELKM